MKTDKIITSLFVFMLSGNVFSDVDVKGYYRKDGIYVQPSHRSAPDQNKNNNWSTKGNKNPYTEKEGTKPTDNSYAPSDPDTSKNDY